MKQQHRLILPLILVLIASLAACSPGHLGGSEIAFVRNGQLWTIDPDGSNAYNVVASDTPVIGYALSPDHHIFAFRQLDGSYAATPAGKHLNVDALTGLPGDLPGSLNTVGIDGGMPLPIITTLSSDTLHSNAWWNAGGTRLLYREETASTISTAGAITMPTPLAVSWWMAQDDQPDGIARKSLPHSFSIPSLTSDSSLAIGNTGQGIFTTDSAGANYHVLAPAGALPGHPLPATLERLLWQPIHAQPALLYAIPASTPTAAPFQAGTTPVELVIRQASGQLSDIATCACTQFAWSPDGNALLYTTGTTYTIYHLATGISFPFSAEAGSVPYWSPDSQFLLLDGLHALSLVSVEAQTAQVLLSDGSVGGGEAQLPGTNALLQPLPNSLWSSDSREFLLLTRGRVVWQGQQLSGGNGLYTVSIDGAGHVLGSPSLVDNGNDTQPGWSYEDPNTSFLF